MDTEALFLNYASEYDRNNGMIELKILHTLEVARVMDSLTQMLGLDTYTRELAHRCAIFHDIGRFEQVTRYGTFLDHLSVDHADLGCEVLREEGFLEDLPPHEQKRIMTAIANHNKYAIEDGLDPDTMLLCKLIRDADKSDIFRVFACENMVDTMGETIEAVEQETITDAVYNSIMSHQCVEKTIRRTGLDKWVGFLGFFFDIYYRETLQLARKSGYYRRPFELAHFTQLETKEKVAKILLEIETYLSDRIGEK